MAAMSNREAMVLELKKSVQPCLRADNFSGAFPNFRRVNKSWIDLIKFQFDKYGGGFVIEIARCPSDGIVTPWGVHIIPSKVTAWDVHPYYRKRIQPKAGSGTDSWFRFDTDAPPKVAADVLSRLSRSDLWDGIAVGRTKAPTEKH